MSQHWRQVFLWGLFAAAGFGARWGMESRRAAPPPGEAKAAAAPPPTSIALTDQTIKSMGLVSKPVRPGTTWRTLNLPGAVIDRPGVSDRGVSAPVAAVVARIHAAPGDTVKPGDPLFTLRLVSEYVQNAQSELFKATEDLKIVGEQIDRIAPLVRNRTVEENQLVELENQRRRLAASRVALRQDLLARGLSTEQIAEVERGKFVAETTVAAPPPRPAAESPGPDAATYEVQELRAELGQQVTAGQALAILSDHRLLSIEGRAFQHEAALVEAAARNGWPVAVEFLATPDLDWPAAPTAFPIFTLGNMVDPVSRTFPFTLALANQSKALTADGRPNVVWRHRPGQKVRLAVPAAKLEGVIAAPTDAVARDGAERVVFRQNGNVFERRPVHVVLEERGRVLLADDGALAPGNYLVQNHASALLRALKAQVPKAATEGGHWHADGSFHATPHGKEEE